MARNQAMTRMAPPRLMAAGGALAGVIGGLVVGVLTLALRAVRGDAPWVALKLAAYPFLGERALRPGFDAATVALGLFDHLLVSAIWGILFALLAFGLSRWATVAFGAAWGLAALFVMMYLVVPLAGSTPVEYGMMVGSSVLVHVTFGVAMGLAFLPFQRPQPHRPIRGWHHGWPLTGPSSSA